MNEIKKCKYCGTTENLVISNFRNKGMSETIQIVKNCCVSCREKKHWKFKTASNQATRACQHCGTTENLITRMFRNKWMKEPVEVIQNLCYNCRHKVMSEATIGKVFSKEHIEKLRISSTGRTKSEETRKKLSNSLKGKTWDILGRTCSEETKKKISKSVSGEKNGFYGKHHTEETKIKLRDKF